MVGLAQKLKIAPACKATGGLEVCTKRPKPKQNTNHTTTKLQVINEIFVDYTYKCKIGCKISRTHRTNLRLDAKTRQTVTGPPETSVQV